MAAKAKTIRIGAEEILGLAACQPVTAVERMARRWYLLKAVGDRPAMLLAPRFSHVPALAIPVPDPAKPWEVWVTACSSYGWFTHLRVSHAGAPYPVTVGEPVGPGRPPRDGNEKETGCPPPWQAYALTVPAGTASVEITKLDEVEARLVAVEFRPAAQAGAAWGRTGYRAPIVSGIVDSAILIAETLHAYGEKPVLEFYRQMRDMGFTDFVNQVYAGSADWSELARPVRRTPIGHAGYANWNEPAALLLGGVRGLQADLDRIRAADLKAVASFRINNEWLADWVKEYWRGPWPPDEASAFSVEHPELWMTYKSGNRNGGGLDFAFPEVRKYRLGIIAEWCDKFHGFDGVCIDMYRHPPMVSYPEHLVQEFKRKTGIDVRTVEPIDQNTMIPEWLAFRAQPFTEFMRSVRSLLRERYGDKVFLTARVANTFDRAMLDGADLRTWFAERLVDQVMLKHRPPANPLDADSRPIIEAAHAAGIEVVHHLGGNHGVDFKTPDLSGIRPLLDTWRDWGSDGFGFYEAERNVRDGRWLRELPGLVRDWARRA